MTADQNKYIAPKPDGEDYMSETQIQEFKTRLLAHQKELQAILSKNINDIKSNNEKVADMADAASQSEELLITLNIHEEAKRNLAQISASLRRIESGDFGYCVKCGVEIGQGRLNARPNSSECITCAQLQEIREKGINKRAMHH